MTAAAATVRHLRVAAGAGAGAVTARALVADALNTRSGSAGPAAQRGLLVLRRLDAGIAAGPGARARVAERVERGLRAAAARAVAPDAPGAADADAVLFRDALDPWRLYAAALLRGEGADLWFFRAVFGHRAGASARPRLRALLVRATTEPGAPALLAAILTEAAQAGSAEAVLADLSRPELATLLATFSGLASRASAPAAGHPSPDDAIIATLIARAPAPLREQAQDALQRHGGLGDTSRILAAALLAAARPGPVSPRALSAAVRLLRPPAAQPPAASAPTGEVPSRPVGALPPEPRADPMDPGPPPPPTEPLAMRPDATPIQLPVTEGPPPLTSQDTEALVEALPDALPQAPAPHDHPAGAPTRFAGAVLAATLLDRLAGRLLDHPDAVEAEIGRKALAAMLDRAGAAPFDPARAAFAPSGHGLPLPAPLPFLLAAAGLPRRPGLRLRPVTGHPGWRLLTCRRGLAILACWRGRAPDTIRATRLRRGPAMPLPEPALILGLQIAARSLARDLTGQPLRALLHRPGWIAADRTHLHLTMPAGAISLAIRRAGLDIDAGWCGWLARVVAIRYDYGVQDA